MTNKNGNSCCWAKCVKLFKSKKNIVNVINLHGVIGSVNFKQGLSLNVLNKDIENAFKDKNTKAVVLNINSPGGSPVQSELIGKRIEQLSKEKNIPVIAVIEDMAASGGYWLACSAPEIIVADNSLVGSLGVIFSGFGLNKAIEHLGVERRVYTKGSNKSLLDPFLPEKQEDVEMILNVQSYIYENFKKQVHKGRRDKIKLEDEKLFTGAIWSGKQAVEIGLADKISDLYTEMQERFGSDVDIKIVNQDKSWIKRKLGLSLDFIIQTISDNILNIANKRMELR